MIAVRPFADLLRATDRNAFDLPVAALAGVSVAFVAFAMPADLLGELVSATGAAAIVPAAAPPLGLAARISIGLGGAALAFASAFVLLRWLDRFASRPPARVRESEDTPRLRKRDVHPDAPHRWPISAAEELGDPEPKAKRVIAPAEEPVAAPTPAPEPEVQAGLPPAAAAAPEPALAVSQPEAPVRAASESLDELMARLEDGLARRRAPAPAAAPPVSAPAPAPQVFPEPGDDRLQSAIQSLQRLAARQH